MDVLDQFEKLEGRMVYIKSVDVRDLPEDVQLQADGHDTLFAVHNAAGQQLALVADRSLALKLVRKNNLAPQPLH